MRLTNVRTVFLLPLLAACTSPATQLVVAVDTDYQVPAELERVEAKVQRPTGELSSTLAWDLVADGQAAMSGQAMMPFSFGVAPQEGETDLEIMVVVEGFGRRTDQTPLVVARARTGFIEGKRLHLPIFLAKRCENVACGLNETCEGGVCVSDDRPPKSLNPYDPQTEIEVPPPPMPDGGVDGGVVDVDGGQPDGGMEECPLSLGAPAVVGEAVIAFEPDQPLLAADLDGDDVTELVAARKAPSASPMAIVDFRRCDSTVVTATAAYGEVRQGAVAAGTSFFSVERGRIERWSYDGQSVAASLFLDEDDVERLAFARSGPSGLAVTNQGGWGYRRIDADSGGGRFIPAPERPKSFSAYLGGDRFLHADDQALRRIDDDSVDTFRIMERPRDPVGAYIGDDKDVVGARIGSGEQLAITMYKEGRIIGTSTRTYSSEIVAGPVPARSGDHVRLFVLLADGTLTGCEVEEDDARCEGFSSRQIDAADVDGERTLVTAWVDQDEWPDVIVVGKTGRVVFASGGRLQDDAAPSIELGKPARGGAAVVPRFFESFGLTGHLLVVSHDGSLSLIGWSGASGNVDRLWPQHRGDGRRSAYTR